MTCKKLENPSFFSLFPFSFPKGKKLSLRAIPTRRKSTAARKRIIIVMTTGGGRGEQHTAVAAVSSTTGRFERAESSFRDRIPLLLSGEDQKTGVPSSSSSSMTPHRYALVVSYACPWACRCLTTAYLKGLEDVIDVEIVHPTWQKTRKDDGHAGWVFPDFDADAIPHMSGIESARFAVKRYHTRKEKKNKNSSEYYSVRDFYEEHDASFKGPFTVPILYDRVEKKIVSNESSEIIRDLNERFQPLAKNDKLDLYPEKLRKEIDEMNEWTYHAINNGVYKCGFARTQEAYDAAMEELYRGLEKLESILQTSGMKYLLSDDDVTETDVRVYQTLVRFDEVYVVYFKTNKKCIREYKHLSEYVKRLHAMPAFQKATNMWDIKTHYFTSHLALNPYGIIPKGDPSWLSSM